MNLQFLRHYLSAPSLVGAVVPSSVHLALAMCRHTQGARHIIELGAGTGAITQHLRASFPNVPTVVVEREEEQAAALETRFGRCKVVAKCLHEVPELLEDVPAETVIVSSLPFLSLPKDVAEPTIAMIEAFLREDPRRKLVQFTYGFGCPFQAGASLQWKRRQLVVRNVPPAWIWTLQSTQSAVPATAANT